MKKRKKKKQKIDVSFIIIFLPLLITLCICIFFNIEFIYSKTKKFKFKENITDVIIEYYPLYSYSEGQKLDVENNYIDPIYIELNNNEINNLEDLMLNSSKVSDNASELVDNYDYKVIFNDDNIYYFDDDCFVNANSYKYCYDGSELDEYIDDIVDEYLDEFLLSVEADTITIRNSKKSQVIEEIYKEDFLESFRYLIVNNDYLFKKQEESINLEDIYILNLDNKYELTVFDGDNNTFKIENLINGETQYGIYNFSKSNKIWHDDFYYRKLLGITDDYVAVFRSSCIDTVFTYGTTHVTYVYNDSYNIGKYMIYNISSPNYISSIKNNLSVADVYQAAQDNDAYLCANLPNDETNYTIEQFKEIFMIQ